MGLLGTLPFNTTAPPEKAIAVTAPRIKGRQVPSGLTANSCKTSRDVNSTPRNE
jgi:hypothetical protein